MIIKSWQDLNKLKILFKKKGNLIHLNLDLYTRGNGLVTADMAMENKLGLTGLIMKEIGRKIMYKDNFKL